MRDLLHTEFVALLNRADVTQAGFGRLIGVTARQVNNWARGRAAIPRWATLIAVMMEDFMPETIEITAEAAVFDWTEVLGVSVNSDVPTIRQAMLRLAALYHPNKGSQSEQMIRVTAAYEQALDATSVRGPGSNRTESSIQHKPKAGGFLAADRCMS